MGYLFSMKVTLRCLLPCTAPSTFLMYSHSPVRYSTGQLATSVIRDDMQQVMQENAAVYRTQETLAEGKRLIDITVKSFRYDHAPVLLSIISHQSLPVSCHYRMNPRYSYILITHSNSLSPSAGMSRPLIVL